MYAFIYQKKKNKRMVKKNTFTSLHNKIKILYFPCLSMKRKFIYLNEFLKHRASVLIRLIDGTRKWFVLGGEPL